MLKRFLYLGVIVLVLLFLPTSITNTIRNLGFRAIRPLASSLIRGNTALENLYMNTKSIPGLRQQNQDLTKEVITLQQQLSDQEQLRQQNEVLQKEVGVTGVTHTVPKIFSQIIVQPDNPLDRTFTIDAGSNQGIRQGQPVINQGFLIGVVTTVYPDTAVVRSILSKESIVQVWLTNSRDKGILRGTGNSLTLTDITQGIQVPTGEAVETSGLGGTLPQGIQVGQVGSSLSGKNDLSQSFSITSPLNLDRLENVFILLISNK